MAVTIPTPPLPVLTTSAEDVADAMLLEAASRRRTLLALLTEGPERHETCCGFDCSVCAGNGTWCERCQDVLLDMADDCLRVLP